MKIAVVFERRIEDGGGFQQELSTALILTKNKNEHYDFIFITTKEANIKVLHSFGIEAVYIDYQFIDKICDRLHGLKSAIYNSDDFVSAFDKFLIRQRVDLVYFISPSILALKLRAHNYIFTVWDLCHRDYLEFPEVNFGNRFEAREYLFSRALPKAISVIVDSELSRDNIISRYGVDGKRVRVLPYLPGIAMNHNNDNNVICQFNIKEKYGISGDYIFYPAQFWPHKNHVYILNALKILNEKGIKLHAAFSGSDKGNLSFVQGHAKRLGLEGQVHCVGFVDSNELPSFYTQAIALVMPTFFGPTNIPPLEAFAVGCPVCYSDLPGLREQVADAAFLMDLENPGSLAEILTTILNNKNMVAEKVRKGKSVLGQWTEKDYWNSVKEIIDSYAKLMQCWR